MRQVLGGLLMGLGILVAGLSGLCTLVMGAGVLIEPGSGPDNFVNLPVVLMFGGPPFLVGLGLFFGGRALLRDPAGPAAAPLPAAPLDPATMAHPAPDRESGPEE